MALINLSQEAYFFTEDAPFSIIDKPVIDEDFLLGGINRNKIRPVKGHRFSTNISIEDIPVYIESLKMIDFNDYKIVKEAYDIYGRRVEDLAALYIKEGHGIYEDKGIDIDQWISILNAVRESRKEVK